MQEAQGFGIRLLQWYQAGHRDLPWRRTKDPYPILISEIMLQQTRVETVKAYYTRFLERFPTPEALAGASESDVLKLWEGLGYYSRARYLQKAARAVTTDYGGVFPQSAEALRALPGVGEYTAAAIASIAFGEAAPAIDGNVKRVASRYFGIREDINQPASLRKIRTELTRAISRESPGAFNQAMMELGATVCLPRAPRCEVCPIATDCDARMEGDALSLPIHLAHKPAREVEMAVCILTFGNRALLLRRQERLLHGLYVFYLMEGITRVESLLAALSEDSLSARHEKDLGQASHVFTHRVWRMGLHHFILEQPPTAEWLENHQALMADAEQIAALPLPTAMKAARDAVLGVLLSISQKHPDNG